MVALEAISAGVPVVVTSESGIAKALEKVKGGHLAVVQSGNREEWVQKITQLSMQNPEERLMVLFVSEKSTARFTLGTFSVQNSKKLCKV